MRISEPYATATGFIRKTLPLAKWRRKDGLSSFLQDMVALRKTLNLCAACERRLPHKWTERYDYLFVRGFYAESIACDRCRHDVPTNMYVAMEGNYARQLETERLSMRELRSREQQRLSADARYLVRGT